VLDQKCPSPHIPSSIVSVRPDAPAGTWVCAFGLFEVRCCGQRRARAWFPIDLNSTLTYTLFAKHSNFCNSTRALLGPLHCVNPPSPPSAPQHLSPCAVLHRFTAALGFAIERGRHNKINVRGRWSREVSWSHPRHMHFPLAVTHRGSLAEHRGQDQHFPSHAFRTLPLSAVISQLTVLLKATQSILHCAWSCVHSLRLL
jgi:hypothetical protein